MRRHFATACLLFAWVCANGAIWDVVQVFAWTRMFTEYAQAMPVSVALKETFDPDKPCELCGTVARAKDQAQKQLPPQQERGAEKLLLALHTLAPLVFRGPPSEWPDRLPGSRAGPAEAVPVPPPRV